MSKLIRIQVIDYKRKMFFINPDYIVELAQIDDDTFYVQLTTAWYSIDKQSFNAIREQLQNHTSKLENHTSKLEKDHWEDYLKGDFNGAIKIRQETKNND